MRQEDKGSRETDRGWALKQLIARSRLFDVFRGAPGPELKIIGVQALAIALLGILTVREFPVWSPIDEQAHFSYIQYLAEEKRLPVLGVDMTSPEAMSIAEGVYPRPAKKDPYKAGIGGHSYEAFQPPLYYLAAVPAFYLSSNHRTKVTMIRLFNFVLMLCGILAFLALCRAVFPDDPVRPFALGLSVFLFPGVVVRSITVANSVLEIPLVLLTALLVWRSLNREGMRDLFGASVLFGLCLLTKLTLVYLAPLVLFAAAHKIWKNRTSEMALRCFGCLAIPVVMLLPWLLFNLRHYGALTANDLAIQMQTYIINPIGEDIPPGRLAFLGVRLFDSLMPQEWVPELARSWIGLVRDFLMVSLFFVPLAVLASGWREFREHRLVLFAVPIFAATALLAWTTVIRDFDLLMGRYLYPVMPLWLLFVYAVYRSTAGAVHLLRGITIAANGGLIAVWGALVSRYYF